MKSVNNMKYVVLTSICILMLNPFAMAQEISVETFQFGTDVQDREIVDADTVFTNDVERIFCLTHITGMDENSTVTHIWYHDNQEMASVELPVRSNDWRTWSSKSLLPSWTGEWSVDVMDSEGNLLVSKSFVIEESGM